MEALYINTTNCHQLCYRYVLPLALVPIKFTITVHCTQEMEITAICVTQSKISFSKLFDSKRYNFSGKTILPLTLLLLKQKSYASIDIPFL